ncbi:HNH endonuclease [Pirellulaceae bacterium]|nr:HNH endonuclease [Pirellulaceae bacterium]
MERHIVGGIVIAPSLQRPTLVLNRNWQPVNVATVARALTMVWNENARIVEPESYQLFDWSDWAKLDPEGDQFIQAVSQKIRIPEVITLSDFDQVPSSTVTFSRRNIFKRDRFTCQYCNKQPTHDQLTIDHVKPRSHGGGSSWENCVLACMDCNHYKADRTPIQAGLKLHKIPGRPTWNPIYSQHTIRMGSWSKFISEAYWTTELEN